MIIERDWSYGYIISFGIYERFNKNQKTCNPHLDFAEDECKLNQVGWQFNFIIYQSISSYRKDFWIISIVSHHGLHYLQGKYSC